jgi:hypothetical protein
MLGVLAKNIWQFIADNSDSISNDAYSLQCHVCKTTKAIIFGAVTPIQT